MRFDYITPDTIDCFVTLEDDAVSVQGIGTYCTSTGALLALRTETPVYEPRRNDHPYGRRAQIGTKSRQISLAALALVFDPDYKTWHKMDAAQLDDAIAEHRNAEYCGWQLDASE